MDFKHLNMKKCFFTFLSLFFTFLNIYSQNTALEIINKVIENSNQIKTLKICIEGEERIDNKYVKAKMRFKINVSPTKVYIYQSFPDEGVEVLFVNGHNNNKAYVRKNRIIKLYLDPEGSLMRKNAHNTLKKSGFKWTCDVLENSVKKYGKDIATMVEYKGTVRIGDGRICHKIELSDPNFKFVNYIVKKGETLSSIGYKYFLSDYMILENNPDVDDYEDVEEGQVIKIPSVYAKKTTIYIDKSNMLPAIMMIYDDKGLFEKYTYTDITVNPKLSDEDFVKTNKEYNF